ncbi:MAG: translational GTPase TypA [Tenericutes bacterium]|nr:translational GTPase TypA [Mycoplasmatota bacterium]
MKIRNVAIIAHVDHGKTTLVDELLNQSGTFRENETHDVRVMDSNDIEKERGITILAKTTGVHYKDYKINIVDTPGHADFGGEVERIMHMVDGVILLVDAREGTMPQTRFVLKKALEANLKPIVVINKVDRENVRISEVIDEVIELFIDLGATDEQIDFPIIYASALNGTSSYEEDLSTQKHTMEPIFETIINTIPEPKGNKEEPLQFQPALLDYNDYVGRIGVGTIQNGEIKTGQMVSCVRLDGSIKQFRVQKLFGFTGIKREEIESASAGEIVGVSGLPDISVGETVCEIGKENPLPILKIEEPTLKMTFGVNTSPFSGKEGKLLTARKIEERLMKELEKDVSLRVEQKDAENWIVSGRGELHLSILIENMRREGFELQVSKPEVIIKEIDGVKCEPYEEVLIEAPTDTVGAVIESLASRDGQMINMEALENNTKLEYIVPSRGLIGFVNEFLILTKGYGIINHTFKEYGPVNPSPVGERKLGVLVSMENGKATAYGLGALEDRGIMFIEPGAEVYEGMIVGENNRDNDLAVNVTKAKNLTNTRSASKDHTVVLKRPRQLTLEIALDYINTDELVEITPKNFRLRKKILNTELRKKEDAKKQK